MLLKTLLLFTFGATAPQVALQDSGLQNPIRAHRTDHRLRQHERLPESHQLSNAEKQQHVKDAFSWAWNGYKTFSWGFDENRPVSNQPANSRNGWGATIVDGLDTLYLMGFYDEFEEAKKYVAKLDWNVRGDNDQVQVFETVIRYVGGLISAYDLSEDKVFINKAVELVDRLLPAFNTPTGIPYQFVNFTSGQAVKSGFPEGASCLAEVGTVQLEFTRLSEITGDWKYHHAGQKVYDAFMRAEVSHAGLFPHLINADTGQPLGDYITWGGMADSFYEYLVKQYVLSDLRDQQKKQMSIDAIRSLEKYLLSRPMNHTTSLYLANLIQGKQSPGMDELACFAPGTLLLAARTIPELEDVEGIAEELMHGCYNAWVSTRTGLAPEIFGWVDTRGKSVPEKLSQRQRDLAETAGVFPIISNYILRPETLESLYYFYQYTHDSRYQDMAWNIFNAIHTYCRANSGFSGVSNVDSSYPSWDDRQESFLFAETFKYLYLIFDDPHHPRISLDEWVFNTEAHPFQITGQSWPERPPVVEDETWWQWFFHMITRWIQFILLPFL